MSDYYKNGQRVLDAYGVPVKVNNNLPPEYWAKRFAAERVEREPPQLKDEDVAGLVATAASCETVDEAADYVEETLYKFSHTYP